MRTALVLVALFVCSVAYADPCTCQQKASTGNPCLCIFGCVCVKAADPVKPERPLDGIYWDTPTFAGEYPLKRLGKQIGGWDANAGEFRWLDGDNWSSPCKSPIPPPQFQPQSFFPQIRSGGRSGGC